MSYGNRTLPDSRESGDEARYIYDFNVYVGEWVSFLFKFLGLSISILQARRPMSMI